MVLNSGWLVVGEGLSLASFLSMIFSMFINSIEFSLSKLDMTCSFPKAAAKKATAVYALFFCSTVRSLINNTSSKN